MKLHAVSPLRMLFHGICITSLLLLSACENPIESMFGEKSGEDEWPSVVGAWNMRVAGGNQIINLTQDDATIGGSYTVDLGSLGTETVQITGQLEKDRMSESAPYHGELFVYIDMFFTYSDLQQVRVRGTLDRNGVIDFDDWPDHHTTYMEGTVVSGGTAPGSRWSATRAN